MQSCVDCKHYSEVEPLLCFPSSRYCLLHIERMPAQSGFCEYEDCKSFYQESTEVVANCAKCAWRRDKHCVLHQYPIKIWRFWEKGCQSKIPVVRREYTWNVNCMSFGVHGDDECQCFVVASDPREVFDYQKRCAGHDLDRDLRPIPPFILRQVTLEKAIRNLDGRSG
jgi:hypothetical protein